MYSAPYLTDPWGCLGYHRSSLVASLTVYVKVSLSTCGGNVTFTLLGYSKE